MVKNKLFLVLPAIYLLASYIFLSLLDSATVADLTKEDHLVEICAPIGFLIASIIFLLIGIHMFRTKTTHPLLHKLSYLALALIFFIAAGEEISWGQRILGIQTPQALDSVNAQHETTFHNLKVFEGQGSLPIGVSEVFGLFTLVLTGVVPLVSQFFGSAKRFFEKFMPIFPWVFAFLFAANWGFAKLGGILYRSGANVSFTTSNMVELKESNYAILYAIVALYLYLLIVRNSFEESTVTTVVG